MFRSAVRTAVPAVVLAVGLSTACSSTRVVEYDDLALSTWVVDEEVLEQLRAHEADHKNRKTVLKALDARLA